MPFGIGGALLSPKNATGQRLGRCGSQSCGVDGAVVVRGSPTRAPGPARQPPGAGVLTGKGPSPEDTEAFFASPDLLLAIGSPHGGGF